MVSNVGNGTFESVELEDNDNNGVASSGDYLVDTTDGDRISYDQMMQIAAALGTVIDPNASQAAKEGATKMLNDNGQDLAKASSAMTQMSVKGTGSGDEDEEGGGNWIKAMVKAMGKAANAQADRIEALGAEIEGMNSSDVQPSTMLDIQEATGIFTLMMSSFTKCIESAIRGSETPVKG